MDNNMKNFDMMGDEESKKLSPEELEKLSGGGFDIFGAFDDTVKINKQYRQERNDEETNLGW